MDSAEKEKKLVGVYGPNDKPKGTASVVPDEPIEIFPIHDGDPDKSPEQPQS